jgi:hypothetical protein
MNICKLPDKCWCKQCTKLYDAKRFQKIKSERYKQVKERRDSLLVWVNTLKDKPCTDCNNIFHPEAMHFDHISNDKNNNISDLVKLGYSKKVILAEIAKCDLVCVNCHAVRTYNRRLSVRKS